MESSRPSSALSRSAIAVSIFLMSILGTSFRLKFCGARLEQRNDLLCHLIVVLTPDGGAPARGQPPGQAVCEAMCLQKAFEGDGIANFGSGFRRRLDA